MDSVDEKLEYGIDSLTKKPCYCNELCYISQQQLHRVFFKILLKKTKAWHMCVYKKSVFKLPYFQFPMTPKELIFLIPTSEIMDFEILPCRQLLWREQNPVNNKQHLSLACVIISGTSQSFHFMHEIETRFQRKWCDKNMSLHSPLLI